MRGSVLVRKAGGGDSTGSSVVLRKAGGGDRTGSSVVLPTTDHPAHVAGREAVDESIIFLLEHAAS
jgi:hypothetical protein